MTSGETSTDGPAPDRRIRIPGQGLRLPLYLALVIVTTLGGVLLMLDIMRSNGITPLEGLILALFAATFGWISMAFWSGILGFGLHLLGRDPLSLARVRRSGPGTGTGEARVGEPPLTSRTAVVMPAHNEDPDRVLAGLDAVRSSLERTGAGAHFDLFLLSDTTDPEIAAREAAAWRTWQRDVPRPQALFYRRRSANEGRKAGNIAEFCRRWGADYDFMVVLDADSVMQGETLVELVRTMEANPDAGLIQTVPIPAHQATLFGRLLQFAGCLYSPILATGQSFWQTDAANYWGHNAILRVQPFTEHGTLPILPGKPPMGGEILSHDFVEAALLRRKGWRTYLLPSLSGSWEEVPGNLLDYATRDRRWAQGSLQHLRLLGRRGFHPVNRIHFAVGAMGYLSSVLWLLMLLSATAWVLLAAPTGEATSATPPWWLSSLEGGTGWTLPTFASVVPLLAWTAVLLFLPKTLTVGLAFLRGGGEFGTRWRLALSAFLEALFAIILAPVMMMIHTRFVTSILVGRDVSWDPQERDARMVAWSEACRRTLGILVAGTTWAGVTLALSPFFFLWLTPIFVGLLTAPLLARWTSSRRLGAWTRRRGLFLVPSEVVPPLELRDGAMGQPGGKAAPFPGGPVGSARESVPEKTKAEPPPSAVPS
jgi:membrane glycosyltransferase